MNSWAMCQYLPGSDPGYSTPSAAREHGGREAHPLQLGPGSLDALTQAGSLPGCRPGTQRQHQALHGRLPMRQPCCGTPCSCQALTWRGL